LSDMFPITNGFKQGDDLSPLLYSLMDAIRKVKINRDGLKLNNTRRRLLYADVYWMEAYIH
jgi:hypothetical protein